MKATHRKMGRFFCGIHLQIEGAKQMESLITIFDFYPVEIVNPYL